MKKGFIALTLALSVTGILLALVYSSSIETSLFYDQAMRKKYRTLNYYYAGDCIDQAILKLAQDNFFDGPAKIDRYHCEIISIEADGDIRHILARGTFQKATVYRRASIRLKDHGLDIISF